MAHQLCVLKIAANVKGILDSVLLVTSVYTLSVVFRSGNIRPRYIFRIVS
jgi:hypothetical protein